MKRHLISTLLALVLALILLLPTIAFAEELGEMDLYAPEVYLGEQALEAPAPVEPVVEGPVIEGPVIDEDPAVYAVAAPELVPMEATQEVALTGKRASAQMNIGETLQIVVNEGETGSFTSKKTNLAIVDAAGLVTALAKGKTGIEFKPDGEKKRTLKITIVDPYEPMGISIAQGKTVGINVGQSLQLGAVLAPETAQTTLTWSSSKAAVAPVDENGVVTGIKEGKTKITVMTANKKKAKITVVVSDPYKPSGVAIAQGGAITLNAGESVQLVAGLIPESAISTLTWSGGKAKVATVDANGVVTAVGKGKVTITVKTGNGKKAKCKVTVIEPKEVVNRIELKDYIARVNASAYIYPDEYEKEIRETYQEVFGNLSSVRTRLGEEYGLTDYYFENSNVRFATGYTGGGYYLENNQYMLYGFFNGMTVEQAKKNIKERNDVTGYKEHWAQNGENKRYAIKAITTLRLTNTAENVSVYLWYNENTGIIDKVQLEVFQGD